MARDNTDDTIDEWVDRILETVPAAGPSPVTQAVMRAAVEIAHRVFPGTTVAIFVIDPENGDYHYASNAPREIVDSVLVSFLVREKPDERAH